MASEPVRAGAGWLGLREPADAAARAVDLLDEVRARLPAGDVVVHDLGCGSGSMARWVAPRLPGPQRWLMYDRDEELLALAAAAPPLRASDGSPVRARTRRTDVTRLAPEELAGASLVTASALLDMLAGHELTRLITLAASAGAPVLIALSVTGEVDLDPADPFDRRVAAAFNAHQRRHVDGVRLLGPDAFDAAVESFTQLGFDVLTRPSPWRLGPGDRELIEAWFVQWLAAACVQDRGLQEHAPRYAEQRLAELAAGRFHVSVSHEDLLARPR